MRVVGTWASTGRADRGRRIGESRIGSLCCAVGGRCLLMGEEAGSRG